MIKAAIVIALMAAAPVTLDAQTLTCSTWQGFRTCQDAHGYRSTEWERQGMRFGQDNRGDRWSTSQWRDTTITTLSPAPGR
jgi:hypothetical protein